MPNRREAPAPKPFPPGSDPDVTLANSRPRTASASAASAGASPGPASASAAAAGTPSGAPLVAPGSDLGSRYHIEALLGQGGTGIVYKAYDRELDRHVAIKLIRPALVADPDTALRFKQELLIGSKVSHRHILRIHDLGEVGGLKFISMAYVHGEDLSHLLRREGRFEIPRAVKIGRQVAEALAAAHAEGVVHRDLKPHNILIDRSGAAYVSDFGLAKSLQSGTTSLTRSGELLGTPRYMAPEQVSGGTVDHRVDLYALGLILYEMVTGTIPFKAESAVQELLVRVRTLPPDPRTENADVPDALASVILRCLDREPDARYQDADAISDDLRGISGGTHSLRVRAATVSRATTVPVPAPRIGRRAIAIGAAALVLAALAVVPLVRSITVPRRAVPASATTPSQATASRFVAVLPLRVLGKDEQVRYLAEGVVEALSSRLFHVPALRVVSSREVEESKATGSVQEMARALGATYIVEGTVQAAGEQVRLVVNLHDIAGKKQTWTQQFTGKYAEIFALEDQVFDGLLGALKVEASSEGLARTAARPTDDIDAYDLYLKGRTALRARQDPAQVQAAIQFFERAISKDSTFALAYAGLADASLLMYREKKDAYWAERARAAAERAASIDDKLPEVLFSLGSVHLNTGKYQEAVVVFKRALELAPNSSEAHRRLGLAYRALERKSEALQELERAVEASPYFWVNHNQLGSAYLQFGEPDKAIASFKRVTELEPDNPVGYENLGAVYFQQGRWEDTIPAWEHALKLQPYWLTYSNLGSAYFSLKRYPEAVRASEQAVALNPKDAITLGNLADALRWSGERDRALETYQKAKALAFRDLQVNPRDATTLAAVALYEAKSGNAASAQQFIRRARGIERTNPALLYYEAVIDTLAGREDAALSMLEKALAGGYPAREAASDPELAPLASKPAFEKLIARYTAPAVS